MLASVFFLVGYVSKSLTFSTTTMAPFLQKSETPSIEPAPISVLDTTVTEIKLNPQLEHRYETVMLPYEKILRSCLGDYCFNARVIKFHITMKLSSVG
jgi:hypothetical protein